MRYVAFAVVIAVIAPACDTEEASCRTVTKEVTLTGTVAYDAFEQGEIEISVSEDVSVRCESDETENMYTPGETVGTVVLDAPGAFETTVTVTHFEGEDAPILDVLAYHNISPGEEPWCEAGSVESVYPDDPPNVELVLESGYCPILI